MIQSNYDYLTTNKSLRPPMLLKRVRWLDAQVVELRNYLKRACKAKQGHIKALIIRYESLSDEIQSKLDKEILQ